MNAVLRHFAVRLWGTAMAGGLLGLVVFPWWQRGMGLDWLVIPLVIILAGCFLSIGWVMNRAGRLLAHGKLKEAAVWERAGMQREAAAAFEQAAALFDSYWLSPLQRRRMAGAMTARLARFLLSRPALDKSVRLFVADYLRRYPKDTAVAEAWLERMLTIERPFAQEHEAASTLAETRLDSGPLQELLFRFFLANGRTDFQALQTYRRIWRQKKLPDHVPALSKLLLAEGILDVWCVEIYIQAFKAGETACLEGIVAAATLLVPDEWNREVFEEAQRLSGKVDRQQHAAMAARFKSDLPLPAGGRKYGRPGDALHLFYDFFRSVLSGTTDMAVAFRDAARRFGALWQRSPVFRKGLPASLAGAAVVVASIAIWHTIGTEPVPETVAVPPPVKELPPIVTDPFTIQVAAYMKPEDAQRLVDRLKKDGLDAFRTKATSAKRIWYQVKVSHFATRTLAQQYGEQLKSKGLIEDFYVANYEPEAENP